MKIIPTFAAAIFVAATVSACSGGDDGDGGGAGGGYCKDIAAAKPVFESLSQGDLTQLEEGFATFHRLADQAPDDVKNQWQALDSAATSVENALKDAGLEFADLAGVQEGKLPEGVDMTKLTTFAADLQKLNNAEFSDARADIVKQAKDSCDVTLGTL